MIIVEDDLSGTEIQALLNEHVQGMFDTSPPDSIHTLSIEALRVPAITMWSAWEGPALMGCGALKAHTLYGKAGFVKCGPFASYRDDSFSRFMVLALRNE